MEITGDEFHILVASSHEFDSHVFPKSGRAGVSSPGESAHRAFDENVSRGWCNGYSVCTHKERCGKNKKRDESLCGEHFLICFFLSSRGSSEEAAVGRLCSNENRLIIYIYIYRFFVFLF